MAPLTTKDLLESPISTSESHSAGSPVIRTPGAHLRSDALSLEVPIKVHGSKVTQVVREITPHTEPFEEQTTTMIVFPQGGVLKMSTMVSAGQMLVVTNMRSKQDAICRIVKVRMFSNSQAYVEVEFTHRQPGYWGVYFPSDGPASSHSPAATDSSGVTATPVASRPSTPEPKANAAKPATAPAAPIVPPAAKRSQPETIFAPIGSQEEVQLPADTTSQLKRPTPAVEDFTSHSVSFTPETARTSSPAPTAANPVANLAPPVSLQDLRGDRNSASAFSTTPFAHSGEAESERPSAAAGASTFGAFSGAGVLSGGLGSARQAGSADDYESYSAHAPTPNSSRNWIVLVTVAVIFAALGGGAIYFKMMPTKPAVLDAPKAISPAANTQPAGAQLAPLVAPTPTSETTPTITAPAAAGATKATRELSAANVPLTPSAIVRARADEAPAATKSNVPRSTAAAPPESSAPKQPASAFASGALNAKLNAHPRAARSKANLAASDAPDVPAISAASSGALSGILPGGSATPLPPMPSPTPAAPVRMGGQIQQPRLISRVLPVYPIGAKNSHVEGDVVINISIGKDGKVTEAKAVSGPALLRQAAVDAVRRWKYQPSKLDGEPIASQTQVTVGFHL